MTERQFASLAKPKRKSRALLVKEIDIQAGITRLLELDGWRPLRTEFRQSEDRSGAVGEEFMADMLYLRYCFPCKGSTCKGTHCGTIQQVQAEVLWIEHKRPGGKPTPQQILWHQAERRRGAFTLIAGVDFKPATIAGFAKWYLESALCSVDRVSLFKQAVR